MPEYGNNIIGSQYRFSEKNIATLWFTIPHRVLFVPNILYLCVVGQPTDIFWWKCFAFILSGKSDSFQETGITTTLIACMVIYRSDIYDKCGVLFPFIRFGFCQNLPLNKRTTPHFLFCFIRRIGVEWRKLKTPWKNCY